MKAVYGGWSDILSLLLLVIKLKQYLPYSVQDTRANPARFLCPWNSPGQNTGVGCHFLLQGIFPTQWSNPYPLSPAWQADFWPVSHRGRPCVAVCLHEIATRMNSLQIATWGTHRHDKLDSILPSGILWKWKSLSRVQLFATSWTIQSMEFSRPEYWSG